MKQLSDEELYNVAKERVASKRSFKIHFGVYSLFVIGTIIEQVTNGFNFNNLIPALGWGIGVVAHALSVYNLLNSDDAIQKEMDKLRNTKK